MTNATHTQGPWYVDDDGFIVTGSAETYVKIADGDCSDLDIDEREANKRLMATAPDLLSALENLLALTELHIAERSKTPEEEDTFLACHHIAQTRAAIAKAKGE